MQNIEIELGNSPFGKLRPHENMKFHFGGGKTPKIQPPPAPPTSDAAANSLLDQGKKRKNAGFSSTILTGGLEAGGQPNVKKLLGS